MCSICKHDFQPLYKCNSGFECYSLAIVTLSNATGNSTCTGRKRKYLPVESTYSD